MNLYQIVFVFIAMVTPCNYIHTYMVFCAVVLDVCTGVAVHLMPFTWSQQPSNYYVLDLLLYLHLKVFQCMVVCVWYLLNPCIKDVNNIRL